MGKRHIYGVGPISVPHMGPGGPCSFSASLDRMMCLMEKEEKEEKKPQDGKIPCMLLHAGIRRRNHRITIYPSMLRMRV